MKKIRIIFLLFVVVLLQACDSFTDTVPKGKVIPTTVSDYKGMIIDVISSSVAYPLANVCSDNVYSADQKESTTTGRAYYWLENFYRDNEGDNAWNATYAQMYKMNVVAQNIMGATEGTEEEKKAILAEAKCWRAYYNWYLQSLYAVTYQANTAATDLSVPLVQVPDLEARLPRSTVEQVTNAIWEDLKDAENLLPEESANRYRPDKKAVYALKARIYFYMGEYDKAAEQAKMALAKNSALNDMRTWAFKNEARPWSGIINRPTSYLDSPEKIWYQSSSFNSLITVFCMSDDLKAIYGDGDLRFKFWFSNLDRRGNLWADGRYRYIQELDYSFTVPEMMLIEAEALARKNDSGALTILDNLRKNRISADKYVLLTGKEGANLLEIVLNERHRELAYSGLRWLDMKRLAKEGLYTKTIVRSFNGTDHKLEPNSKLYVFPIPGQVLSINTSIIPNDRKQ